MAKNFNHIELIERYLENKMTGAERTQFEDQLMHDPLLKNELDFQKDIINSIKSYRKAEIKARLDHIKISPSPGYFNLLKIAASVSISSLLIWGAYNYLGVEEEPEVARVEIASDNLNSGAEDQPFPEIPAPAEKSREKPSAEIANAQPMAEIPEPEKKEVERPAKRALAPQVNLPDVMEHFDDVDPLAGAEDPNRNVGLDISGINENEVIEVKIENPVRKKEGFHYQFYDGKLFLFGDFKAQPYEIIELNTDGGRRLFLNYNDNFFVIKSNQVEIAPLTVIQDSSLIRELIILKENKTVE